MALVVLLRGVNVGGHRTFRPSQLVKALSGHDVVNVGAAGTFVVRKPGPRAKFLAKLRSKLPFETEIMICPGKDIVRILEEHPFGLKPPRPGEVRFVSVLAKAGALRKKLPVALPSDGAWLVQVLASDGRYVFGRYRRHMKTIRYLGQVDKLFSAPATSRNWNTITAVAKILTQR
jgi:uncharacterized protein (DUF1697 family)